MAAKLLKARVLRSVGIQGKTYDPDQVVEGKEDLIKGYEGQGALDSNEAAVKYCTGKLKSKVIKIGSDEDDANAKAEAEKAVTAAEAVLAAANTEDEKEAATAALKVAQDALAAL